jgi:hypothetical protein
LLSKKEGEGRELPRPCDSKDDVQKSLYYALVAVCAKRS